MLAGSRLGARPRQVLLIFIESLHLPQSFLLLLSGQGCDMRRVGRAGRNVHKVGRDVRFAGGSRRRGGVATVLAPDHLFSTGGQREDQAKEEV